MSINISLSDDLLKDLDSLSSELDLNRDELIIRAIRKYLLISEIRKIRNDLNLKLDKNRFKSEDDIFDAIS